MKKITLFLTERCNRNCSYCDISKLGKRRTARVDTIKKYCGLIKETDIEKIILTGGETGMLQLKTFTTMLNELKGREIQVNTNGLFMKKYPQLLSEVKIQYHPVSEITEDIEQLYENVIYHIPVHRKNHLQLGEFLEKYRDINFHLVPYDHKSELDEDYLLRPEDLEYIVDVARRRGNVSSLNILERAVKMEQLMDLYRTLCFVADWDISLDLVNMTIDKCVCSHERAAKVKLTEKSFKTLIGGSLKFEKTDLCSTCYHCVKGFNDIVNENVSRI